MASAVVSTLSISLSLEELESFQQRYEQRSTRAIVSAELKRYLPMRL